MPLTEFQIIDRYFKHATAARPDVVCGVGDDGAILSVPAGRDLVVSIDTLVEGVHFPVETDAEDVGYKSLAVNLSDLAAMGADPAWFTLALTLPEPDVEWLGGFAGGMVALANAHGIALVGGDITRGPLSITVQAHGLIPCGQALRRGGAAPGDLVYVTGTLGDAGLALYALQRRAALSEQERGAVLGRLNRPTPRVPEGRALRGLAHAAIDVSDGLIADLGHLLEASGVGAVINVDRLPASPALRRFMQGPAHAEEGLELALTAGDDYELCFTAPPARRAAVESALHALGCACTCIGVIDSGAGLRCRYDDGREYALPRGGYDHFLE